MHCTNINHQQIQDWSKEFNKTPEYIGAIISLWQENNNRLDEFPSKLWIEKQIKSSNKENEINFSLKSVDILTSQKADEIFRKGDKNNWSIEKILQELQVPKEQQELIKSFNTRNREEILTNLLANYSYTVEINTAKESATNTGSGDEEESLYREAESRFEYSSKEYKDFIESNSKPTQHYSNLTVPGGTNYTENEITTPGQLIEEKPQGIPVKQGVAELFESNPELANAVYEALGFNQELAFTKSDNTIDDDFYIKDELIITKELQNIRTNNFDGSINRELSELKDKLNKLPIGSKFNVSEYTKPSITNLEEVLNKINLSESNKILLEKIRPLIKDIKIEYVDKFILANSGAVYSDKYNTIRINKSEKNIPLEELLMHELLHAATFRKISYFETNTKGLSEKEKVALTELESIRKVLKEASNKYWDNRTRFARSVNPLEGYRTDSIHEIISYAFTNKEFRDAISEIPYRGNKSILDKLVELIANIFGVKQNTVLNALLANTEVLLNNNQISPQQKQQALQAYSQYLDTIFPDSKVKDIVYHGTNRKFDKFDLSFNSAWEYNEVAAIFFSNKREVASNYIVQNSKLLKDKIVVSSILNIKDSIEDNHENLEHKGNTKFKSNLEKAKKTGKDSYIARNINDGGEGDVFAVFEPEQIHILGSKQDIKGFKNWIKNNTKTLRMGAITPSIKGHAQFSTPNGIGWFRSDDKLAFTGFLEDLIASGTIKKVPCG